MLARIDCSEREPLPATTVRRRYPVRTLHLIDVENLVGTGLPCPGQVCEVYSRYEQWVGFGPADQVVVACNHLALVDTALGWPDARYRVRSGPDGADLELLDVLHHENVVERFSRFVIASGDGIFAAVAASLAEASRWVTVVSRRESLSTRLRMAACEVIYIDAVAPAIPGSYQPNPEAA
jgi:hypothetical protein